MGRNAGSQMFWTHALDKSTGTHTATFVCDHHKHWGQDESTDIFDITTLLAVEIQTIHGNVEQ